MQRPPAQHGDWQQGCIRHSIDLHMGLFLLLRAPCLVFSIGKTSRQLTILREYPPKKYQPPTLQSPWPPKAVLTEQSFQAAAFERAIPGAEMSPRSIGLGPIGGPMSCFFEGGPFGVLKGNKRKTPRFLLKSKNKRAHALMKLWAH